MKQVSTKYPPGTLLQNIHIPNVFRICLGWHMFYDGDIDTISPTNPRWPFKEEYLDENYRIVSVEEPEDS